MNVHRRYGGARNEAFLSLRSRRVPHTADDPPPLVVTNPRLTSLVQPAIRDVSSIAVNYLQVLLALNF